MGEKQTIITPAGRVVRYNRDQVGNDLTAHLGWCATHHEPLWIYGDGSWECPFDLVVGWSPDTHHLTAPPWESPPPREHELSDDCWCGPQSLPVKRDDGSVGWVIVHQERP